MARCIKSDVFASINLLMNSSHLAVSRCNRDPDAMARLSFTMLFGVRCFGDDEQSVSPEVR